MGGGPGGTNLANSKGELERFVPVKGAVELEPGVELAGVVHGELVAGLGDPAAAARTTRHLDQEYTYFKR